MNNQERVLNYISTRDTSALYFKDLEDEKKDKLDNINDFEELVYEILKTTKFYESINTETEEYETSEDRNRSSLDIWRHVKFFVPKATIFEVMEALYKIAHYGDVFTLYCPDISRRVFKYDRYQGWISDRSNCDEYYLHLYEWENINEV